MKPITEPEISIDQFFEMDLRVCKVLKCQEIRKAHSNYKLTLFDGLKERVIVSSIKNDYKPEELEGKERSSLLQTWLRQTDRRYGGMLLARYQ